MPSCRARRVLLVAALVLAALAGACARPDDGATAIRVGAGSTAEQQLLAALAREVLQAHDLEVEIVSELGDTAAVREAAIDGRVDLIWAYSGATWSLALDLSAPPADARDSVEAVAAEDAAEGLRWIGPTRVDAKLAMFVAPEVAPPAEEATLSWLAGQLGQREASVCADPAYLTSPGGWPLLVDTYAVASETVTTVPRAESDAVAAVAAGECLAGLAPATSGAARQAQLVPLIDDQRIFPALVVAPVVVEGGRADRPAVESVLLELADALGTDDLAALNALVEEGIPIDEVAGMWADTAGLA